MKYFPRCFFIIIKLILFFISPRIVTFLYTFQGRFWTILLWLDKPQSSETENSLLSDVALLSLELIPMNHLRSLEIRQNTTHFPWPHSEAGIVPSSEASLFGEHHPKNYIKYDRKETAQLWQCFWKRIRLYLCFIINKQVLSCFIFLPANEGHCFIKLLKCTWIFH